MIITLVAAAAALAAATTGYLVAQRKGREGRESASRARASGGALPPTRASSSKGKAPPAKETAPLSELPLSLGDVVMAGSEERWLAGALIAREEGRVVSAIYLAPEGSSTRAVAVFELPRREIFWMDPVALDVPNEPPATLEIGGAILTRRGRIPVVIERVGQGAPRVDGAVLWASYDGGGREIAVVIAAEGRALAWAGRRLDADEYERLGAGGPDEAA